MKVRRRHIVRSVVCLGLSPRRPATKINYPNQKFCSLKNVRPFRGLYKNSPRYPQKGLFMHCFMHLISQCPT